MASAKRVMCDLNCMAPAEEIRMPERAELNGLNAYLLLFVSEISLINLTEQYALAQAAVSPLLLGRRGDTSPSVAAVLRFVSDRLINPACRPSLSTHFSLPLGVYLYHNPFHLFVNQHFMANG